MTEMVLPQFGMGMADGTIVAWHKAEGDPITQGEPLCDVEAAKTTVEVPAPRGGILQRIVVPAGTNVPVNTVIALIGDTALAPEAVPAMAPASTPPEPPEPRPAQAAPAQAAPATRVEAPGAPAAPDRPVVRSMDSSRANGARQVEPRARRAARLHGLDLSTITGSGPGGRIIESDVLEAARRPVASDAAPIPGGVVAPGSAHLAPVPAGTGLRQLRMRCDAGPLLLLLEQLAPFYGTAASIPAALLKATARAMGQVALSGGAIGLRSETGECVVIDNPAALGLSNIATRLAAPESVAGPSPALVIEWHEEDWLSEVVHLDPSVPASLSFGLLADHDGKSGQQMTVVLTIGEAGPSLSDARQLLSGLRHLLLHPLAIVA